MKQLIIESDGREVRLIPQQATWEGMTISYLPKAIAAILRKPGQYSVTLSRNKKAITVKVTPNPFGLEVVAYYKEGKSPGICSSVFKGLGLTIPKIDTEYKVLIRQIQGKAKMS